MINDIYQAAIEVCGALREICGVLREIYSQEGTCAFPGCLRDAVINVCHCDQEAWLCAFHAYCFEAESVSLAEWIAIAQLTIDDPSRHLGDPVDKAAIQARLEQECLKARTGGEA